VSKFGRLRGAHVLFQGSGPDPACAVGCGKTQRDQPQNGIDGFADWEERFRSSARSFAQAFQAGDSVRVLSFVFDRLYVLRNQLVHGGSTWNSGVNRAQVRDGAAILAFLLPVFVDLMMDNPHEDWGRPFYPVVE
jgi:hypothetical protein